MNLRRLLMVAVTVLLLGAVFAGVTNALEPQTLEPVSALENVRDYALATDVEGMNYAIDGDFLFAGGPGAWNHINTPAEVIPSAIAVDAKHNVLYLGAANEMAIYRSNDQGENWLQIPLGTEAIGGVTDIAVDAANMLVYVGTDTDGVHRLRDVGSSMIAAGHLLLDERVEEVVTDNSGLAMTFVRTPWNLYRAEEVGLRWVAVEDLPSPATAIAIAETTPPTVFVGTASSGVRMSQDGVNWQAVNNGLNFAPGSQLYINDVSVDPAQPEVIYTSGSLSFGSTVLHTTAMGVSMSTNSGAVWEELAKVDGVAVTNILPVPGQTGAVYALTEASRTPLALGEAPTFEVATISAEGEGINIMAILAWVLAGLAAVAFAAIAWMDLSRRKRTAPETSAPLAPVSVRRDR